MKKDAFYRRVFLNRPRYHAGAYFLGYVREADRCLEGSVIISDCDRKITLEFWATSAAQAKNALHKARVLADAATDFADAYEKAYNERWGSK